MHGVDLAQRIRRESDVPVVLTTGNETFDLCTDSEAYGAVACLMKPINLDELLWTIDCALACRRAGQRDEVAARLAGDRPKIDIAPLWRDGGEDASRSRNGGPPRGCARPVRGPVPGLARSS